MVGIVADLKYVVVYLHIAEAHAAFSLYSHYRTDIRIFGLERIHIYPGLEGQLPECGEGAVQLERRHFVNIARSQIYGLADCRAVLPEGDCTSGFWTSILSAECATVIEEAVRKAHEHHLEMVRN